MEKTSTALIERVQNEEEEAFSELFSLLYKNVYYTAYRICKSDDDAKEVSQQTFIQVHRSIKNLKEPDTFDVWLHRIVVSKCYNLFAKRKDMIIDPETSALIKNEEEYREYLMPKETSRRQSDLELLNSFIDELPEKYRTLLILAYYQEHTMEEVAEILALPVGTVKSRLSVARNLLKKKVNEYEKVEHIQLNFHAWTPALFCMAYQFAYQHTNIVVPYAHPVVMKRRRLSLSSNPLYISAVFTLSVLITFCGYRIFDAYFNNTTQDTAMRYLEQEEVFQPVTLDGNTVFTPQEAYYTLLVYAHCEVELSEMTKEELYHFKPLYDALKQSNGSYYHRLREIGWERAYQKLLSYD